MGVYMFVPGSNNLGANRLRSNLPPRSESSFTYSNGCHANFRLAYVSGRSEDHRDVDICGGARVVAGQDGTLGPAVTPTPITPSATRTAGVPSPARHPGCRRAPARGAALDR